jgi:general secretion pathway protein O
MEANRQKDCVPFSISAHLLHFLPDIQCGLAHSHCKFLTTGGAMSDRLTFIVINALLLITGIAAGRILALASLRFHPAYSAMQWLSALYYPSARCVECHTAFLSRVRLLLPGWIWPGVKCHACQQSILYVPLFEVVMALLWVLIFNVVNDTHSQLLLMTATALLLLLSAIDQRHQLLPDILVYLLLWLGLFHSLFVSSFISPDNAIIGAMAGYGSLWFLAVLYRSWRGWDGLGYGDLKLFAALGAWCGWQMLPLIAVIATLSAFIAVLLAHLTVHRINLKDKSLNRNVNSPLPFGPFLAVAGWGVLMFQTLSQNPLTPV